MRKILLAMIIAAGFSTAVLAQATATATASASATIVTPIAISVEVDMDFGNIAVSADEAGTVVLSPDGTRLRTGGVTLPATTGTPLAAEFEVTGANNYTYAITFPTPSVILDDDALGTMTLDAFTSTPSATGALSALGAQTITVGATLTVGAGQTAGIYTNANAVEVSVVYN